MEDGSNEQESGSTLREKLEATIGETKALRGALAERVAAGHKFVTAEDLKDVGFDQMDAKAAEISAQRVAEREGVLRDALAEKGFQGEELEAALAALKGGSAAAGSMPEAKPAPTPFTSTGSLGGAPPARIPDQQVRGIDRIRVALEDLNKKS